ncbi:MAG: ribulose-phosphate 3-epimerase [Bacteroidales bacterium]|jgi:ribulose-phosphate 3-epimerase|nr:ribulose-phosphate 3-epimerase [Bacteroidales bacterium]MDD3701203.1 ribulose-phosphate 3-epimerase [Bacteroidales bacterium]MDY0368651.1 ribulose-phosphate 3-epimerase [Bacteroidales bacterium]
MKPLIAPSLLSADFLELGKAIHMINQSEADWIHCDVMDGRFVPNISFGLPIIRAIKKLAQKPLDVHLMIVEPERYITAFHDAGADMLSIHIEASIHAHRSLQQIRSLGMKAGIVLNPHTALSLLEYIVEEVDYILLMSVNPGFGGQQFIEHSYRKISELKEMLIGRGSQALIEVDGGVDVENAAKLVQHGADILVAGNAIFNADNPQEIIHQLKNCHTS